MTPEMTPVRTVPANDAAVLFVHGFGGDIRETWQKFPDFLADDPALAGWDLWLLGYPTRLRVDLVGLWSGDPDLDKIALRLRTDLTTSALQRYKAVCLIAHSMGGLVIQRALLDDANLLARTSHMFLFGTPSGGLIKASLARIFKPQLRNMASDGPFVGRLREDWTRRFSLAAGQRLPFHFMAAAGESDEFVPAASAIGPFPENEYPTAVAVVAGNHIDIVKPDTPEHPSVRLVTSGLLGRSAPAGPWNAARVAVELCDFNAAIAQLEPHRAELDTAARIQLALALDSVGRREDAIATLVESGVTSTDAMGTLAGRLKRRWLTTRRESDAERARALYEGALAAAEARGDHAQAYYLGINVAFLASAYGNDDQRAREMATRVLEHCQMAAGELEKPSMTMWRLATEGEAHLVLRDSDTALARYAQAMSLAPAPWQIVSMFEQALHLARIFEDDALAVRLETTFGKGRV